MSNQRSEEDGGLAGVVCPTCLLANDPVRDFCADCGAPIGNYAAILPIERIMAEGFAFRAAVEGPPKIIILVGTWLVFFPGIFMGTWLLFYEWSNPWLLLPALLTCVISWGIPLRVTVNFVRKWKRQPVEEDVTEEA